MTYIKTYKTRALTWKLKILYVIFYQHSLNFPLTLTETFSQGIFFNKTSRNNFTLSFFIETLQKLSKLIYYLSSF